ncbi:MAG: hypothetical protein LV480_14120 [Methylacidiphilales bacterium]|nr:hypothetical protein [Candidatus Methylacidiphilales bacterium]
MTIIKSGAEIIGHRGSSHLAPENTLASFKLGWRETTTCELDIRPTRDGRLLVIHDATTRRTTRTNLVVAKHPLRDLQQLDAGSWKGAQWKGLKLPSLAEVISAMPAGKRLLIEIKAGPEVVPELARVIRASGKARRLQLQGFSFPACAAAKNALPAVPVYLLVAFRQNLLTRPSRRAMDQAIAKAQAAGLNGVNVNDTSLLNPATVQKIHSAGLKVHVWTVDQVKAASRLLDAGVDGLITNRPGWLKAQLASCQNAP